MTCFRWRIYIGPHPEYPFGDTSPAWDEERREVVESVLGELRNPTLDADARAACADLLKHLAFSSQHSATPKRLTAQS